MIEWVAIIGYVCAWLFTARRVALRIIEDEASREAASRQYDRERRRRVNDGPLVDPGGRVLALIPGFIAGMLWPITWLGLAVSRTLVAPSEVAEAEREELVKLRALAREHNLPLE